MDSAAFHDLCREASTLAVTNRSNIGQLRLTQARGNEPTIREPEMLHAFCRTLDGTRWGTPYGIEVPTEGLYRFVDNEVDEKSIRARHDLVLFEENGPDVLIEFKREQPAIKEDDCPAISKDIRKLIVERANGRCMFHICHASDSGTIPSLISKYEIAFAFARSRVDFTEGDRLRDAASWFALYVLVLYDRNEKNEPYLHRYGTPPMGEIVTGRPMFRPHPDGKVPIPPHMNR